MHLRGPILQRSLEQTLDLLLHEAVFLLQVLVPLLRVVESKREDLHLPLELPLLLLEFLDGLELEVAVLHLVRHLVVRRSHGLPQSTDVRAQLLLLGPALPHGLLGLQESVAELLQRLLVLLDRLPDLGRVLGRRRRRGLLLRVLFGAASSCRRELLVCLREERLQLLLLVAHGPARRLRLGQPAVQVEALLPLRLGLLLLAEAHRVQRVEPDGLISNVGVGLVVGAVHLGAGLLDLRADGRHEAAGLCFAPRELGELALHLAALALQLLGAEPALLDGRLKLVALLSFPGGVRNDALAHALALLQALLDPLTFTVETRDLLHQVLPLRLQIVDLLHLGSDLVVLLLQRLCSAGVELTISLLGPSFAGQEHLLQGLVLLALLLQEFLLLPFQGLHLPLRELFGQLLRLGGRNLLFHFAAHLVEGRHLRLLACPLLLQLLQVLLLLLELRLNALQFGLLLVHVLTDRLEPCRRGRQLRLEASHDTLDLAVLFRALLRSVNRRPHLLLSFAERVLALSQQADSLGQRLLQLGIQLVPPPLAGRGALRDVQVLRFHSRQLVH
mmetsp:Transcript_14524/g.51078  ORF Transcript_14524/g.51078 Transcript_14524/m.51078 type:complete len:559 (-) Transcript_14524:2536-4212(-)